MDSVILGGEENFLLWKEKESLADGANSLMKGGGCVDSLSCGKKPQHAEPRMFSRHLLQDPRRGCAQAMGCNFYSLFACVGRFSGIISCTECIHNTIHNNAN